MYRVLLGEMTTERFNKVVRKYFYLFPGSGNSSPEINQPIEPEVENPTPASPPFIPGVVDSPKLNNVRITGRRGEEPDEPIDIDTPVATNPINNGDQITPAREQPVAASADRPSLQKALFTYALPVVCAWFGTIVTDLF